VPRTKTLILSLSKDAERFSHVRHLGESGPGHGA
jgi:hypothetical protein